MAPDYKQIYTDLIKEKFPEKLADTGITDRLERLHSAIDIMTFNHMVFGDPDYTVGFNNQRLRSYDKTTILEILQYQKKNKLTNLEISNHFKISRNTIAKWKAIFEI